MSSAGVGNSFWGSLFANVAIEVVKNTMTPKESTAGGYNIDQRYIPVLNAPKGPRNSTLYFDLEKQSLIYEPDPNYNDAGDNVI